MHCPEHPKYQTPVPFSPSDFPPNIVRPFNSHTRVLSQFRNMFLSFCFSLLHFKTINFLGQLSLPFIFVIFSPFCFFPQHSDSISYSINSNFYSLLSDFNYATALDFLTVLHLIHLPFHPTFCFFLSECSILVASCFCLREHVFQHSSESVY